MEALAIVTWEEVEGSGGTEETTRHDERPLAVLLPLSVTAVVYLSSKHVIEM